MSLFSSSFARTAWCWAFLLLCAPAARADLPLNIEDLIAHKGRFKLDLSVTYANAEQQGISVGQPIVVQTGRTSFVTIPNLIGERRSNTDSLVSSAGVHYGLTGKAEIYARSNHLHIRQRNSAAGNNDQSSASRFADAWAGINYQFKQDNATPALLGFAEIALREKHRVSNSSFNSVVIGFTTYTAVDPVVFSLTGMYRISRSRKDGDEDYQPGNLLMFSPSVSFAVNERVTLITGFQWSNLHASRFDGEELGQRHTRTDLLLGLSYGFSAQSIMNVNLKSNVSGRNGADLRASWLRQF